MDSFRGKKSLLCSASLLIAAFSVLFIVDALSRTSMAALACDEVGSIQVPGAVKFMSSQFPMRLFLIGDSIEIRISDDPMVGKRMIEVECPDFYPS